jgi:DNA-binding NarL/FixJ family response regulator
MSNAKLVHELLSESIEQQADMRFVGAIALETIWDEDQVAHPLLATADLLLVHLYAIEMPLLGVLQKVRAAAPELLIFVFGLSPDTQLILSCLEGGAAGYCLEEDSITDVLDKLRALWQGKPVIDPTVVAALIKRVGELTVQQQQHSRYYHSKLTELTAREMEVLNLLKRGHSNRAIAEALVLEIGTVKNHVHHILQKLDVTSRRSAVRYAKLFDNPQHG